MSYSYLTEANYQLEIQIMIHYMLIAQDELHTLEGQKAYCEQVLAEGGLQSWKSKEYNQLIEDYTQKIVEAKERIQWISEQE